MISPSHSVSRCLALLPRTVTTAHVGRCISRDLLTLHLAPRLTLFCCVHIAGTFGWLPREGWQVSEKLCGRTSAAGGMTGESAAALVVVPDERSIGVDAGDRRPSSGSGQTGTTTRRVSGEYSLNHSRW